MEMRTVEGLSEVARCGEPRTGIALELESIAPRHQIAVLRRRRTRRPRFRVWDRPFWISFSRWWPQLRDSLIIVQPETVLRWRRGGWSALWRYRSRGRWRGGRPRVSGEVRNLIARMARENLLWGAPRIHGELLMLGFRVSQATVSRLHACTRPTAGAVVADFSSQSSYGVRSQREFRGKVKGRHQPGHWLRFGPARAIRGRADFAERCSAHAQQRAITARAEQ